MSEIKGQLLGILLVMLLFTGVMVTVFASFKDTSTSIANKAALETAFVADN